MRAEPVLVALGLAVLAPAVASAAGADACIAAHEEGQVLRKRGALLAARGRLAACAAEACPTVIRAECTTMAADVDAEIPSVVFAVVDGRGNDIDGASVSVDGGAPLALDGRAVSLDPGPHRFVFSAPGADERESTVVLREAERLRRVSTVMDAPVQDTDEFRVHPLALVFGGIGAVGAASFVVFGLKGRTEENCRGNCSQEQVDTIHRDYLIADVSLAIGLASFAVGTYFFLSPPAAEPAATASTLRVVPAVGPGVGLVTARGAF